MGIVGLVDAESRWMFDSVVTVTAVETISRGMVTAAGRRLEVD
jgi:hypothetical protein